MSGTVRAEENLARDIRLHAANQLQKLNINGFYLSALFHRCHDKTADLDI